MHVRPEALAGLTILATLLGAPALAQDAPKAAARFVDANGEEVGQASLTQTRAGVLIEIKVSNLPADQWVAFHVHEEGACDPATGHESAKGHFNPEDRDHGFLAGAGAHAGDMPNQRVGADGVLHAQVVNAEVSLSNDADGILGRALMIHSGPDDYQSQPSGEAGARLACAVIE